MRALDQNGSFKDSGVEEVPGMLIFHPSLSLDLMVTSSCPEGLVIVVLVLDCHAPAKDWRVCYNSSLKSDFRTPTVSATHLKSGGGV